MVAFIVLLYAVYAGSMLIDGIGLGTGLFPGGGSFAITIVPAIVAAILIAAAARWRCCRTTSSAACSAGRRARGAWPAGWRAGSTVPALAASGVRTAIELIRSRDPGLLGALAWWGFDICVLWAMFHAFGSPPPFTVIWMAYFVGMLGNLLPLPGGIGGVEGGMIGAFAAFGVNFDLAVWPCSPIARSRSGCRRSRRDRLLAAAPDGRPLARGAERPARAAGQAARRRASEPAGALQGS